MSRRARTAGRYGVLVLALSALTSCSTQLDLKQALQVTDVITGWYDFGVVDGKNKLVPSVTFKLTKSFRQSLLLGSPPSPNLGNLNQTKY